MKAKPEYVEDTEAFTQFQNAMRKVLAVPHAVIQRRIEVERKASAASPVKRFRTAAFPLAPAPFCP